MFFCLDNFMTISITIDHNLFNSFELYELRHRKINILSVYFRWLEHKTILIKT